MQVLQPPGSDEQPRPMSHWACEHEIESVHAWLPVHNTSHAHEVLHLTSRHDCGPEQVTSHSPGPHSTPRQVLIPLHSIVHDAAF
jgi:hypothetical protein